MKLSATFLLLASAVSVTATRSIRSLSAKASLLSKSRRLEDENQDENDQQDEEFYFLADYSLKLISCIGGEQWSNPEDGEREYSTVVYRLCPKDDCDSEYINGCKEGYGDFIVGINTFVDAWLEDKKENMQQDDNFNIDEYSECREYENENDDQNGGNQQGQYYVGPTCDEELNDIALGFFSDYTCTTVPEGVSFSDISGGWSLPYSSGGLTGADCEACYGMNENGEYELKEMCTQLYEWSGKCMTGMESYGYYGKDESSCEYIAEVAPSTAPSTNKVGAAIGWTILALVIVGAAGFAYTKWWMKKKQGNPSMAASDGVMN